MTCTRSQTVFGFTLAAVTTPLLAMCVLFRSARYSMAPLP
jgi:hypothetical protein